MPIYEYECQSCGNRQEVIQKHTDAPLAKCRTCGGSMRKLISNTTFVLKGTGWYKTDYASGSSSGTGKPSQPEKGSVKKTEQKTEAKKETVAGSATAADA